MSASQSWTWTWDRSRRDATKERHVDFLPRQVEALEAAYGRDGFKMRCDLTVAGSREVTVHHTRKGWRQTLRSDPDTWRAVRRSLKDEQGASSRPASTSPLQRFALAAGGGLPSPGAPDDPVVLDDGDATEDDEETESSPTAAVAAAQVQHTRGAPRAHNPRLSRTSPVLTWCSQATGDPDFVKFFSDRAARKTAASPLGQTKKPAATRVSHSFVVPHSHSFASHSFAFRGRMPVPSPVPSPAPSPAPSPVPSPVPSPAPSSLSPGNHLLKARVLQGTFTPLNGGHLGRGPTYRSR